MGEARLPSGERAEVFRSGKETITRFPRADHKSVLVRNSHTGRLASPAASEHLLCAGRTPGSRPGGCHNRLGGPEP